MERAYFHCRNINNEQDPSIAGSISSEDFCHVLPSYHSGQHAGQTTDAHDISDVIKKIAGIGVLRHNGEVAEAEQKKGSAHQETKACLLRHKGAGVVKEDKKADHTT